MSDVVSGKMTLVQGGRFFCLRSSERACVANMLQRGRHGFGENASAGMSTGLSADHRMSVFIPTVHRRVFLACTYTEKDSFHLQY